LLYRPTGFSVAKSKNRKFVIDPIIVVVVVVIITGYQIPVPVSDDGIGRVARR
jgi:hypothetical protein